MQPWVSREPAREPVLERVLQSKTASLPFAPAVGTTDYTVGHFGLDPGTTRSTVLPAAAHGPRAFDGEEKQAGKHNTRFG